MKVLMPYRLFFCAVLSIFISNAARAQVYGCKDPAATNYNPSASLSNGSCTYATTSYLPPVKTSSLSDTLQEISGLQMAGNFLWGFNDGGGAAAIYRIDTLTGHILQTVTLDGATNVDWEDIAFDGSYFYIGDFGNNANGARTDLKIYKFPLALIPDYVSDPTANIASAQIDVIHFTYSNQTSLTPVAANSTKWDCEAMLVDSGKVHLFSKNWVDVNTTHYVINSTVAGAYIADSLETLATSYLVTGADKNSSGTVVLLGYQTSGFYNHYLHILSDFNGGFYFNGNKRRIDLPNVFTMGQAEGICFRNETYGYISNERISSPFTVTQKLRSFNLQTFIPVYVALPIDLVSFSVSRQNSSNQLAWTFSAPANNLKVLAGTNRNDFTVLKSYRTSSKGVFYDAVFSPQKCYKLVWQQASGAEKFSNTICINGEPKGFQNLVLSANGELNFVSAENSHYQFRLIDVDGRIIGSVKKSVVAGSNDVWLGKQVRRGALYVLQIQSGNEQKTLLLRAQ